MHFYRETGCQSMQAQAVGASLQIGSTIWGIAPNSWMEPGGRGKGKSKFYCRMIINAPEDQRGLHVAFEFRTRWFALKRVSAVKGSEHDRSSVGWYLRKQMCSGVNV